MSQAIIYWSHTLPQLHRLRFRWSFATVTLLHLRSQVLNICSSRHSQAYLWITLSTSITTAVPSSLTSQRWDMYLACIFPGFQNLNCFFQGSILWPIPRLWERRRRIMIPRRRKASPYATKDEKCEHDRSHDLWSPWTLHLLVLQCFPLTFPFDSPHPTSPTSPMHPQLSFHILL